ncbi:hypothetical protein Tco_0933984 [Tanacetum coccineum]
MAALRYRDEHNKMGYLQKPKGSDDYHQVLDFLRASHMRPHTILATIDETPYTITKDSVTGGKLTFYKNKFSPQWRFLVHTILQCLSTKSGSWDQFGSSLAVALICLSDGRKFLQTILGIETRVASQYRVFKLSSKLFANMKLNFKEQPMPLLATMLSQAPACEGAGVAAQAVPPPIPETIPETRPEPDQPQDHLSTPPRQQTSDPIAPVCEHGQSLDPNIASFSRTHETDDEPFTSTNVDDEPLGGSFHASPPRSNQTPLIGHTSGGCGGKVGQESQSNGGKLKPKKRKVVVSDSDQDEEGEQTVDLDALIALANAVVTFDSNIPPSGPSNDLAASSHIPSGVPTDGDFAPAHSTSPSRDLFKGKGVAEPSSLVSKRTKKQLADSRLSEIEAAKLEALERERFEKEKAEIARQDEIYAKQLEQEEEMSASQRETRQEEVLSSAKHYSNADWIDIMAQVHGNAGLSSELLDADMNDDNFAERICVTPRPRRAPSLDVPAAWKRKMPAEFKASEKLYIIDCQKITEIKGYGTRSKGYIIHDQRYVVPTGKDNFIVSAGRPNMVPAGRTIGVLVHCYDLNPHINDSEARRINEYLIKFLVMNGKKPLILDYKTFVESTRLDYAKDTYCLLTGRNVDIGEIIYIDLITRPTNKSRQKYVSYPRFVSCALVVLLGSDYTQDETFRSPPTILSNSNFSKDPSKVTLIELTAFMVAVNIRENSVTPLPFTIKNKKGKSQTVTPTLPQSQGPKDSGSLPQKRKKPKSKKTPTKTKKFDPKNSVGNIQPIDTGLPFTVYDEGAAKTTPLPEGLRGDKDPEGLKPPADIEPQTNHVVNPLWTDANGSDTQPLQLNTFADVQAFILSEDEMAQESDDEDVLEAGEDMDEDTQAVGKHEEAVVSYADLRTSIKRYHEENVDHREQSDRLEAVKEDPALNKKVLEATKAYTVNCNNITELLSLAKTFDFSDLKSLVETVKAALDAQNDHLETWADDIK